MSERRVFKRATDEFLFLAATGFGIRLSRAQAARLAKEIRDLAALRAKVEALAGEIDQNVEAMRNLIRGLPAMSLSYETLTARVAAATNYAARLRSLLLPGGDAKGDK